MNVAEFPAGVEAPVQHGPNVRALAVCVQQYQLVLLVRICELLCDLCDCHLSEGTLTSWVQQAAAQLRETVERIADWLNTGRLTHGDETGVCIGDKLHWLHINNRWAHASGLASQTR
jgi:transposase